MSKAIESVAVLPGGAASPELECGRSSSYGQILKASALVGGASVINIGFGIIRTKAMAMILGPAGLGLLGIYGSIADITLSVAGMGIQGSGVRQIAEAVGSKDEERIARTGTVLRRMAVLLGVFGAGFLVVFCQKISLFTFGSDRHAAAIALLSLVVFFRAVSGGQGALVQGMRRIADLAAMSVLGAFFGTLISIPMIYFMGENGVVPSLVAVAAMSLLTSWWFSRKVTLRAPRMTLAQTGKEAAGLLKLGFAFMASGLLTMGAAYGIRIILLRALGYEAVGLYQSAWALGGLYVGFILEAMGADFYPRLTGISTDHPACNRLVNEQAQISLLLAGPGVIATLTLAPWVIALFYSAQFVEAVAILRWICLGMTLRVVAWPMGYVVLAKDEQKIFFWTEVAATVVHVGLAWLCIAYFGLAGAGVAFFGLYVWHGILVYVIVRRLTGFRWSVANLRIGRVYLPLIGVVFCSFYLLSPWQAAAVGLLATAFSCFYSLRVLLNLVSPGQIPAPIRRILAWVGWVVPPV